MVTECLTNKKDHYNRNIVVYELHFITDLITVSVMSEVCPTREGEPIAYKIRPNKV